MKTLTQIRNEVAMELGYTSFEEYIEELFRAGSVYTVERITKLTDEVASRACREALKNASLVGNALIENGDLVKKIILNECNIPVL